ncbi:EF-hand 4 domain containing protein [Trichuris trichiura]|uniref:EF-hand 4 domain containing protein n=1 Tax=Trichuris trichiura TaxID=36087 RepID=A0A077Z8S2_TRITR|nr:EF-hand 4 domain containing protein [Trichuris trichiura]
MAQAMSVGLHQKVSSAIATWSLLQQQHTSSSLKVPESRACVPQPRGVVTDRDSPIPTACSAATAAAVACQSKSPVSSSQHSSSLRSPQSESKWTSFDESEEEGSSIEQLSTSEQQVLLPAADDQASEGDENLDESFVITVPLFEYYTTCFNQLLEKTQGKADLQSAVRGQDPGVFEFFLKSQLPRDELGKVWKLADVNEDGYLNLDEFCVAMHLIVRRVKGHFPIPSSLPASMVPARTPPRNVTPLAKDPEQHWTHFNVYEDATLLATNDEFQDSPLKDFTNSLMLTAEKTKTIACPIACHVSPEMSCGGETSMTSENDSLSNASRKRHTVVVAPCTVVGPPPVSGRSKVISPQAPKGPPPKPPPRPAVRHIRSASLDLTKKALGSGANLPPSAPAPRLPKAAALSSKNFREASVQTDIELQNAYKSALPFSFEKTVAESLESNSVSKGTSVEEQAKMQKCDNNVVTTTIASSSIRQDVPSANLANSKGSAVAANVELPAETKDWKKRCDDKSRLNGFLERELKQLMELRIGLESELDRLRKSTSS